MLFLYSVFVFFCDCFLMELSAECVGLLLFTYCTLTKPTAECLCYYEVSHLGTVLFLVHIPPPVIPKTDSTQIL